MDFHLTKEQLLVRKMYREFAETEVKPLAEELDEEERVPLETVEKMAKLGMMGFYFPKQYGGAGGDVLAGRARIVESDGRDVTGHYQLAAWLALSAAREAGCQAALLTDGSPTCGSQFIYDGSFRGRRKAGAGVAAELLRAHGITVFSDGQIPQLLAWMAQREQDDDSM